VLAVGAFAHGSHDDVVGVAQPVRRVGSWQVGDAQQEVLQLAGRFSELLLQSLELSARLTGGLGKGLRFLG